MSDNENYGDTFRGNINNENYGDTSYEDINYCEYDYRKKPFDNQNFCNEKDSFCNSGISYERMKDDAGFFAAASLPAYGAFISDCARIVPKESLIRFNKVFSEFRNIVLSNCYSKIIVKNNGVYYINDVIKTTQGCQNAKIGMLINGIVLSDSIAKVLDGGETSCSAILSLKNGDSISIGVLNSAIQLVEGVNAYLSVLQVA